MKKTTGNEYFVNLMHSLIVTAEDLHIRSYSYGEDPISTALIQSWMCGRRSIDKSAAKTVFQLASTLNAIAWDRYGSDIAWKRYNIRDLAMNLVYGTSED